jgi:hypothetical protein
VGKKEMRKEAQRGAPFAPPMIAKPNKGGPAATKKRVLPLPQNQAQRGSQNQQWQQQKKQQQGAPAAKKVPARKTIRSGRGDLSRRHVCQRDVQGL